MEANRDRRRFKIFFSPQGKLYRMNVESGDVEQLISVDESLLWAQLDGDGMEFVDCYDD